VRLRGALALAAVALAAVALVAMRGPASANVLHDPEDLRAFYCAGKAVAAHADPYRAEPLRACEVRAARAAGLTPYERLAVPAPLPGYALAPLAILSFAPLDATEVLYVVLVAAALALTVAVASKLGGFPWPAVAAAFVIGDGLNSVANGQLLPFVVLGLCAAGLALRGRHTALAALCAMAAAIEPHVALPALIALFIGVPAARWMLVAGLAVLAVIAVAALGLGANVEYVARVLPAHAHSELWANSQFSLSTLLARSGANATLASALGELSYAVTCALGIIAGLRFARRFDAPELIVLLPPAFALLGGPFVHLTQMAVAIPALLVLMRRLPESRPALAVAIVLLALPWQDLAENDVPAVVAVCVAVTFAIGRWIWGAPLRTIGVAVFAFAALGASEVALRNALARPAIDATAAIAAADRTGVLAEATWTAFNATDDTDQRLYLGSHAPTWAGLTIFAIVALRQSAARAAARRPAAA